MRVKKYFSVPASSIFFQYGYYTDKQINKILPPISQEYTQNNDFTNTYLDNSFIHKHFKDAVTIDYYSGLVTQVQISQDDNKFTLSVTLIGQGQSQMTHYAKLIDQKQATKRQSSINTFINKIAADYDKLNPASAESIAISSTSSTSSKRYVTFNFIVSIILPWLQKENTSDTYAATQDLFNQLPLPSVGFIPQCGVDIDIVSTNPNILLFNNSYKPNINNNKITPNLVKITGYDFIESKFKELTNFNGSTKTRQAAITERFNDLYGQYEKLLKEQQQNILWLGNVYFQLNYLLSIILKTVDGITPLTILNQLQAEVNKALPTPITIHNTPDAKLKTYMVNLNGLNYIQSNTYTIPNFGSKSVVKQLKYTVQIPAEYERIVLGRDESSGQIVKALFGGSPIDINKKNQEKNYGRVEELPVEQKTAQQLKKQLNTLQKQLNKILNSSISDSDNKINFNKIQQKSYISELKDVSDKMVTTKNKIISIESKTANLTSGYYIRVDVTLDFIANIQFGHIFKLQFNPLGWNTVFYVNEVKQDVTADVATTVIQGYMFK